MQLYRHFKNFPYRYLNRVIHSETLESLVLYETLYDNPKGKLWVRPEANFFETIEYQGVKQPRFAPLSLDLQSHTALTPELLTTLREQAKSFMTQDRADVWLEQLPKHPNVHVGLASLDEKAVGFSMGYERSAEVFFSWLVCVHPEFSDFGVASSLLEHQQAFCRQKRCRMIQSKSPNWDRDALLLKSQQGFLVVGTEPGPDGLDLVFEQSLAEPGSAKPI